jgi:hypothetical protein
MLRENVTSRIWPNRGRSSTPAPRSSTPYRAARTTAWPTVHAM